MNCANLECMEFYVSKIFLRELWWMFQNLDQQQKTVTCLWNETIRKPHSLVSSKLYKSCKKASKRNFFLLWKSSSMRWWSSSSSKVIALFIKHKCWWAWPAKGDHLSLSFNSRSSFNEIFRFQNTCFLSWSLLVAAASEVAWQFTVVTPVTHKMIWTQITSPHALKIFKRSYSKINLLSSRWLSLNEN